MVKDKFSPSVQIAQKQLYLKYQQDIRSGIQIPITDTGFRCFSQFEEDGLLLYIFAAIGMGSPTFLEIGSDDGINSNCANLFFNFGWHGMYIDANKRSIERGRYFYKHYPHTWWPKPIFVHALVQRENVNELILNNGMSGEIGLLSIDIDGNDYWIWDSIEVVQPQVVIIETQIGFGQKDMVVPYNKDYIFPGEYPHYHGASPTAMYRLGQRKGYRLVCTNRLGFNFIFVRKDLGTEILPEVSLDDLLKHQAIAAARVDKIL